MKKRNLITLLAICTLLFSCGVNQGNNSEPNNGTDTHENEKDLAKAIEDANALMDSIDLENYIREEKEEIQNLIIGLDHLINTSTSVEEISAAIQSVREYLAFAKTKAQHEQEDEEARLKIYSQEKERLLKKVEVERPNRFRKEELNTIKAAGVSLKEEIEKTTTLEELEAISFDEFDNLVNNSKSNAEYTMEEWFNFPLSSKWDLVNQHAANWRYENSTFKTQGLGGDDVAYMISSGTFSGDLSFVLRSKNTVNSSSNFGFLIGNMNPTGNGFDGYLVNYDYASDHQYLQVWYFDNANAPEAANVYQYIGGWVYNNQFSTTLTHDDIRVVYDGEYIKLMNNDEYLKKGDLAYTCIVDLKYNDKYAVDPEGTYSIGFFNWDGANLDSPRILELKEFETEQVVVGKEKAIFYANQTINNIDLTPYEENEQNAINAKIEELRALFNEGTYAQIMSKIQELKEFVATSKTHEQLELEKHPDISTQILDNIYSKDSSKYTPSNWSLVDEHALAWNHAAGSHVVTTTGLDGYCMDAATHTNYTFVFKATNVFNGNPYNAAWPGSAIILGGRVDSSTGNYFKGIYLSLSSSWGFQLYDAMAGSNKDLGCYGDQFRGGVGSLSAEGTTMRITVKNGAITMFYVDPNTGAETRLTGDSQSFSQTNEWKINVPSGHFGFLDWDQKSTTFEILEFRDLD